MADGRNGGAQRTVWEVLTEMERFNGKAQAEGQGAVALVLDFLWSGLGDTLQQKILRCCAYTSSTRGECSSKDVRSQPSLLSCQGPSGVACFCALFCRMRWAKSKNLHPLTALVKGRNKEVAEMTKKVMKKLKEERPQVVSR